MPVVALGSETPFDDACLEHSSARSSASMKIATFNINNINKRLENLLAWLRDARPDVACLQELKANRR
jgi:endonuclease/exonuclease/phosphatase family metal-dependent hydrolase